MATPTSSPSEWTGTSRPGESASVDDKPDSGDCVTINLDARCLGSLLASRQLHVQDFRCSDAQSKEQVRWLLMRIATTI